MAELSQARDQPGAAADTGTAAFFAAAFAITWTLQLPALLALHGVLAGPFERFLPLAGLGTFGPAIAALLLTRVFAPKGGVRALLRPLLCWRVAPAYYLLALATPGALLAFGIAAHLLVTGSQAGAWVYPPDSAQRVVALLLIPLVEEIGWRGFALPRLLRRHGALRASLILGVLWALWHVPMFELASVPRSLLPVMVVFFCAGSVVITWLYARTSGSLLIAVLAHMGAHLDNSHLALPGNPMPLLLQTAGYCVFALVLVLGDRGVFAGADARA